MKNKIFITGANGFIGKYVTTQLSNKGYDIRILTRTKKNQFEKFKNVSWAIGDITQDNLVEKEIEYFKPDTIIHLAAVASPVYGCISEIYETNIIGSEKLLSAVKKSCSEGTTVLLASTAGVYGNSNFKKIPENASYNPCNHYSISKVGMECISQNYRNELDIKIVRPFNIIGVGQKDNFIVPKLVKAFASRQHLIKLGNIEVTRDFVDVETAASLINKIALSSGVEPSIYNICSGKGTSLLEIISCLRDITGFPPEIISDKEFIRKNEIFRLVGDPSLIQSVFPCSFEAMPIKSVLEKMLDQFQ